MLSRKSILLAVLALSAPLFLGGGAAAAGETIEKSFEISLPDSRPFFFSANIGGNQQTVSRDGAKDQSLVIKVSGTRVTDVGLSLSPACEGTAVDQRVSATLGGDSASVKVTRKFTPISPVTGLPGTPSEEVVVDRQLGPGPSVLAEFDICS